MTKIPQGISARFRGWKLLAGLPALLAICSGVSIGIWLWVKPAQNAWYVEKGQISLDAADYQTAAICYARLLEQNPTDANLAHDLALSLQGLGQNEAAATLMSR
jgi:tetratricopeptide (TPR) repeat protein